MTKDEEIKKLKKENRRLKELLKRPPFTPYQDPACDCEHVSARDCPVHKHWFKKEK